MPYVYSTLTADNIYAAYAKAGDREQQNVVREVLIKGGHGLIDKNFITALGVATEVTDDELDFLRTVDAFKQHEANGFISYDQKKVEPEKAIANMKRRDKSSQLTPADYEKGGMMDVDAPKVGGI
jgi:hypothetical protein